jgi:hypothetical protein
LYKNSVRTSQETYYVSDTKPSRLMLFRKIFAVYCESHMEHRNAICGQNADFTHVKADGIYRNHWALKGQVATSLLRVPDPHSRPDRYITWVVHSVSLFLLDLH